MNDEKKQNNVESSIRGSILRSKINKKKNVTPKIMKGAAFMGGAFALGGSISHVYKAFANEDLKDQQNQSEKANVDTMLEKYAESYANQTPSESWAEVLSVSDVNSDDLKINGSLLESASFAAQEDLYMNSLQDIFLDSITGSTQNVGNTIAYSFGDRKWYYDSLIAESRAGTSLTSDQDSMLSSRFLRSTENSANISNSIWKEDDAYDDVLTKWMFNQTYLNSNLPKYSKESLSDSESWSIANSNSTSTSEESGSETESESDTTSESRSTSASQSASASRSFSRFMSAIGSISRAESRSESASTSHSISDSISTSETSESHTSSESTSSSGSESVSESISTSQSSSEKGNVPQTGDETTNAALILGAAALGAAGIAGNSAKKKNDK